jgi:hypothetical protein
MLVETMTDSEEPAYVKAEGSGDDLWHFAKIETG